MARKLTIKPNGWPLPLKECPPGHFVFQSEGTPGCLGFKTEYNVQNKEAGECFNEGGEYLCIGADALVQPVFPEWEDFEEDF